MSSDLHRIGRRNDRSFRERFGCSRRNYSSNPDRIRFSLNIKNQDHTRQYRLNKDYIILNSYGDLIQRCFVARIREHRINKKFTNHIYGYGWIIRPNYNDTLLDSPMRLTLASQEGWETTSIQLPDYSLEEIILEGTYTALEDLMRKYFKI